MRSARFLLGRFRACLSTALGQLACFAVQTLPILSGKRGVHLLPLPRTICLADATRWATMRSARFLLGPFRACLSTALGQLACFAVQTLPSLSCKRGVHLLPLPRTICLALATRWASIRSARFFLGLFPLCLPAALPILACFAVQTLPSLSCKRGVHPLPLPR